ncbi:plasmid replication protein RepC [Mangrovicoccus sp. HB161399]|uniref:plasmid replication protein RepC n=1 Tax=Mangrovicoccus sp. HB161399 TaxID=2720392 RepID=UPI00352D6B6E
MHFRHAPDGAGPPHAAEAAESYSPLPARTGWRRQDGSLLHAELLGREGERVSVAKSEAMVALKRAAALIGLKPAQVLLMDTLAAFSQAQDWDSGQRPVVWPSNALLTDRTGLSLSALRRHLRKLCDAGVLCFRDSPNGKRWGRRGTDGLITEAYGFDLSPLAARAQELRTLHERHETERLAAASLRRQIAALIRTIRERRLLLPSGAAEAMQLDTALARPHPRIALSLLSRRAAELHGILAELDAILAPESPENGTHIEDTNKNQESDSTQTLQPDHPGEDSVVEKPVTHSVQPEQLLQALPNFAQWAGSASSHVTWAFLASVGQDISKMAGISGRQWERLRQRLGEERSVQALALVVEKSARGLIRCPSAYLEGMARKAALGQLDLDRSIRGQMRLAHAP